ncbi:MAG: DUF4397 domain-containing protein [Bryobacteraceae bacterium]|nr:DUF4397 domain-containing protein [Bryobacteraceae bacterium]
MLNRQILRLVAPALLLATAALAQNGRVRVLHASPDAPNVDVLVDGVRVLQDLPFREYSEYLSVPAGRREIRVNVTGTSTTVLQATPEVAANTDYTAIAVGYAGGRQPALDILLLTDDNRAPAEGQIRIRAVHAAPGAPNVDIYAGTPFEPLERLTPALTNVPFRAASGYLAVPILTYHLRVAVAGTQNVAISTGRLPSWGGMVRTFVAVDSRGGGAPFEILVLPDRF